MREVRVDIESIQVEKIAKSKLKLVLENGLVCKGAHTKGMHHDLY